MAVDRVVRKDHALKLLSHMKQWCLFALKLVLTIGILYYIFTIISVGEVIRSISVARPWYIIVALVIAVPMVYISAWRLKILTDTQGMSISVPHIAEINFVTNFYGLLLPGYLTSGAIRWYRLSRVDGKRFESFAAIAFSRINYTIMLTILGIVFLALDMPHAPYKNMSLGLLVLLCILFVIYLLGFTPKVFLLLDWLNQGKVSFIPVSLRNRISKLLVATSQYHSLSRRSLSFIVGLSLLENLLGILSAYLLVVSLNINITFINIAWVRSVIQIITMLPISFSGIGIREGGLIVLLGPYGVPGSEAVALSFLLLARAVFLGGIGGVMEARNLLFPTKRKGVEGSGGTSKRSVREGLREEILAANIDQHRLEARYYEFIHCENFNPYEQRRLRASLKACVSDLDRSARCLDVGAGTGNITSKLVEMGFKDITCVDISADMLEVLRKNMAPTTLRIVCSDVDLFLDSNDETYRLVTMGAVVHHLPDPKQSLERIFNLLIALGKLKYLGRDCTISDYHTGQRAISPEVVEAWFPGHDVTYRYYCKGRFAVVAALLKLLGEVGDYEMIVRKKE